MDVVQTTRKVKAEQHEVNVVQNVEAVTVKDVWTKFLFNKKNLCFQVLLEIENGEVLLYQELKDYSEYKNTLKDLQCARSNDAVVKIPKKSPVPSG